MIARNMAIDLSNGYGLDWMLHDDMEWERLEPYEGSVQTAIYDDRRRPVLWSDRGCRVYECGDSYIDSQGRIPYFDNCISSYTPKELTMATRWKTYHHIGKVP